MTAMLFLLLFGSSQRENRMTKVLRVLGAALLLAVVFLADGEKSIIPIPSKPVINLPHPAMLVLTDTGEGTTVSTLVLNESSVLEALEDGDYEWRRFDDSFDIDKQRYLDSAWKEAYKKALADSNGVRPWVIIGNPKKGESVALPDESGALVELISKYGDAE